MLNRIILTSSLLSAALLTGCGGTAESSPDAESNTSAPARVTTVNWLLDAAPDGAVEVGAVKASDIAEGDRVVIRGRIGGQVDPMTEDSGVFLIVDVALRHCGQIPGDKCRKPWDYCCEPKDNLLAHMATITLVDEAGAPLTTDATATLAPLDIVVVEGTLGPRPSADVLTVHATGIYHEPEAS